MRGVAAGLAAILAGGALAPGSLAGQRHSVYAAGGVGVLTPTGSLGSADHAGWQLAGEGLAMLSGSVGLALEALYGQTGHKSGVAGHTTLAGGTANGTLWLGRATGRVRLLLLGGVGAFRVNVDVPGFGSAAATKLGLDGGAGVVIGSGRRREFLTVQYVTVRTSPETTAFVPIRAGLVIPL